MVSEGVGGINPNEYRSKSVETEKIAAVLIWSEVILVAAGLAFWVWSVIKKENGTIIIPSALLAFYIIFCFWLSAKTQAF
jgi:uncharacterized membrane protein